MSPLYVKKKNQCFGEYFFRGRGKDFLNNCGKNLNKVIRFPLEQVYSISKTLIGLDLSKCEDAGQHWPKSSTSEPLFVEHPVGWGCLQLWEKMD